MPLVPVDILEPPLKPIPESKALPPIDNRLAEQKEEVYKGAFDASGAAPTPEDPSRYAREFEDDVEYYLVKFERACSNMSRALTEYQDTMDIVKAKYDMKLHPDYYWRICRYMVDFCPAALEVMSSIADYGRGLASRYSKKYPKYWKNPKYEKLLIRGYTAQKRILEVLIPSKPLKLPISNSYSGYVNDDYTQIKKQLLVIEGIKSMTPTNGGNFHLSMTESNIKKTMDKIMHRYDILNENVQIYANRTKGLDKYDTQLTINDMTYTREEARRDLEKDVAINTSSSQSRMEELEAIQRALKKVKWYNYRLEPHKRGKQYKIDVDNLYREPSKLFLELIDEWANAHLNGDIGKAVDDYIEYTNYNVRCGLKIPLVATNHFETELNEKFNSDRQKMLDSDSCMYMIVGELRNFRMMKGDGKPSDDPTNINYNTDHKVITPKTFRGTTAKVNTNHPCNWGIVAEVYVYPQYKYIIDSMNLFQLSRSATIRRQDLPVSFTMTNVAICDQGNLNVDVMYDVEDFFKADDKHKAEKEEYERDVVEALRDERAGNKSAKSERILKDADRMLNNLGYFKEVASKPKWSEQLEDIYKFPSGIDIKDFEKLNLATLMLNEYVTTDQDAEDLIRDAFNFIEKIANRYYWYLPKPGEPGYIGDTKGSLEKDTIDLLKDLRSMIRNIS